MTPANSSRPAHSQQIHTGGCLACEWCGTKYDPRSFHGRIPRFCKASHRVRACERRRGLLRPSQPPTRTHLPEPAHQTHPIGIEHTHHTIIDRLTTPIGHETGSSKTISPRNVSHWGFHRARPGGLPNRNGYVPSLCGAMIKIIGLPTGVLRHQASCRTCEQLADLHPTPNSWWKASTQRTATALANDLRSTVLAVGQAITQQRDPIATLTRVDQELRTYITQIGLFDPLQPSLHPRSTAA